MGEKDPKETLRQARRAIKELDTLREKYRQLKEDAALLQATDYSGVTVKCTAGRGGVEKIAIALEDAQEQVILQIGRVLDTRQEAEQIIARLGAANQRDVLTRRYILGQSWEKVADGMGYSFSSVMRIHRAALDATGKLT